MSITIIIVGLSVVVSIIALQKSEWFYKLQFNPYQTIHRKEWHRLITHAFIHANWMHLGVNMWVLYLFGRQAEAYYNFHFETKGMFFFILLYLGGILFACLPSIKRHANNPSYNAVGASGAVAAVLFAAVVFDPWNKLYLMFIPIPIPAFVFAILYLAYEIYQDKRSQDNIAHDAHVWGAIFGILFTITIRPVTFLEFIGKIIEGF